MIEDDAEDEGYWALVEPAISALPDEWDDTQQFHSHLAGVGSKARHLLAVHYIAAEVNNGGFFQLFWNSTGILAPTAVKGLIALKLPQLAALVDQAVSWFGPRFPMGWEERRATLSPLAASSASREIWDPFIQLDSHFYSLQETEGGGLDAAMDLYASHG